MKKQIMICVLSTAFMSGCSTFSSSDEVVKSPVPTYEPSEVSEKEVYDAFISAAQNVDRALQIYTDVNTAAKREELTYEKIRQANWQSGYTPKGLGREITITWEGPIRPLISQLAKEVDYRVRFIGDLPPVPYTVAIVANNKPIIDVLRDVDAKTQDLVDIDIYEDKDTNIIEVRYVDRFK